MNNCHAPVVRLFFEEVTINYPNIMINSILIKRSFWYKELHDINRTRFRSMVRSNKYDAIGFLECLCYIYWPRATHGNMHNYILSGCGTSDDACRCRIENTIHRMRSEYLEQMYYVAKRYKIRHGRQIHKPFRNDPDTVIQNYIDGLETIISK